MVFAHSSKKFDFYHESILIGLYNLNLPLPSSLARAKDSLPLVHTTERQLSSSLNYFVLKTLQVLVRITPPDVLSLKNWNLYREDQCSSNFCKKTAIKRLYIVLYCCGILYFFLGLDNLPCVTSEVSPYFTLRDLSQSFHCECVRVRGLHFSGSTTFYCLNSPMKILKLFWT